MCTEEGSKIRYTTVFAFAETQILRERNLPSLNFGFN